MGREVLPGKSQWPRINPSSWQSSWCGCITKNTKRNLALGWAQSGTAKNPSRSGHEQRTRQVRAESPPPPTQTYTHALLRLAGANNQSWPLSPRWTCKPATDKKKHDDKNRTRHPKSQNAKMQMTNRISPVLPIGPGQTEHSEPTTIRVESTRLVTPY